MDTKHLHLTPCGWCEEVDTANLCQGVAYIDNEPWVNGYFIECKECDASTKSYHTEEEAAKNWNATNIWGVDY